MPRGSRQRGRQAAQKGRRELSGKLLGPPDKSRILRWVLGAALIAACVLGALVVVFWRSAPPADDILAAYQPGVEPGRLVIDYPLDGTLFPPEIAPPTFRWKDADGRSNAWLVVLDFEDGQLPMAFRSRSREWSPPDDAWEAIKLRSLEKKAKLVVLGVSEAEPREILTGSSVSISTSQDKVGAPLFFREVNLPFIEAVRDPAKHIRWRFGPISSKEPPPIVLDKLPVCGNCHSFSADGKTLALEVDSGNDKASYAIAPVQKEIVLNKENIITWNDFKREDGQVTFGLLCQASPDGRYVVGTVKDRALAVYKRELEFSQLFFLIKGYLAIYDRQNHTYTALPGADDPRYVQTNATWSPDGKELVFTRSRELALDPPELRYTDSVLVPREAAAEFLSGGKTFHYDLYRIPFNEGKGGTATPIPGASNNGLSNYFPKFSPDGKWIVFCRARSFSLLQPDSELYIIPAQGGEARRLRGNTSRMNSWHSWSPNGKWLVFSSKANTVYTQLFLTHIDEQGSSTPPVVLSRFTVADRAANIPEFANTAPDAIASIREKFLNDVSFCRAAEAFKSAGDVENAMRNYQLALQYNPKNLQALMELGIYASDQGRLDEAKTHLLNAIHRSDASRVLPNKINLVMAKAHCNLGIVLAQQRHFDEAIGHCREALKLEPEYPVASRTLGALLLETGRREEGIQRLAEALRADPDDSVASCRLAEAMLKDGKPDQAVAFYQQALKRKPDLLPALLAMATIRATSGQMALRDGSEAVALATKACKVAGHDPRALDCLAAALAESGRFPEAVLAAQNALQIACESGDHDLRNAIIERLTLYQQNKPFHRPDGPAALGAGLLTPPTARP